MNNPQNDKEKLMWWSGANKIFCKNNKRGNFSDLNKHRTK